MLTMAANIPQREDHVTLDAASVTRVGCKRDARKALMGDLVEIGHGAYRRTFRDASGKVAYKVCHEPTNDHANRDEAQTVQRCRMSDTGREFVAPTTLWVVDGVAVVAQPMMARTARRAWNDITEDAKADFFLQEEEIEYAAMELDISDIHYGNWGFDHSGRAWIIDANLAG